MAPSPENDNTPKAPDKNDKNKLEKPGTSDTYKENDKDEKTLSNLNDGELKALLDEAINYKNPKDREGKSKLFKDLLNQAEESERIARATSAGGSEVARHYNTSAARRHHGRHGSGIDGGSHHGGGRHPGRHRKPSSISENMMHGGSLDNLAKEELFLESAHYLVNKMKTVSARQREGGSLPCDVNSSVITTHEYQFLEEAKKNKDKVMKNKEYTAIDIESSLEAQRLLDHDSLAENYTETQEITIVPRYTSTATLQISATPVDDPLPLDLDRTVEKKPFDLELLSTKVLHSKYNVYIPNYRSTEERKVDENGNALHQNPNTKAKKKKIQTDKNVVVLTAESVEGHRSDIINDLDKLIQYVMGDRDDNSNSGSRPSKSNVHKSKQLHKQHASEDSGRSGSMTSTAKKQRAHSSKGKESRPEMKKSNSLGEISTAKLEDFAFVATNEENIRENKVVLRGNKNQSDKPKERRSWGNVEPPFQIISSNVSTENLETAENWVVSKPKKKSKKRRNSVSSSSRRQTSTSEAQAAKQPSNRVPSPDFRGKSVPHSEKSDSSDADSVHSLPLEGMNVPISYADIAKNAEKAKEKKNSSDQADKVQSKDKSLKIETECNLKKEKPNMVIYCNNFNHVRLPPDLHNAKSFPAISSDVTSKSAPPDVNDTKSFPAMSLENHNIKSPVGSDVPSFTILSNETNYKQFPPDVNDTKSFPAMPTDGTTKGFFSLPLDINSAKHFSGIASNNNNNNRLEKTNVKNVSINGTLRNVSPANKGSGPKGSLNNNNNLNVKTGSSRILVCGNDIQNDLSIIHSNEKESIQYNAQMLPPNIPDVQTIEKMHFMNCHPQQPGTISLHSTQVSHLVNKTAPELINTPPTDCISAPPSSKKTKQADCDISDRTMVGVGVEGSRSEDEEKQPPPVVILSGIGNKEVTGLVFGFDINEQLLHEDICENFIARFMAPEGYTQSSHNHDKIVNFIGSAWEAIINQSNGKVQYYTEES